MKNAIKLDENNATAYYMAAQAFRGLQNPIQAIVMLTKATVLNENYLEAYLLRAEVLWDMRQANDSLEDIERVLSIHPENEDALLLKGKIQAGRQGCRLQGFRPSTGKQSLQRKCLPAERRA